MSTKQPSDLAFGRAQLAIGGVLVAIVLVVVVVTQLSNKKPTNAATSLVHGCPVAMSPSAPQQHGPITEYGLPHPQSDLMLPALDAKENVWFGEMGGNRLGRLDATTGTITEWNPPQGQGAIMGIEDIWQAIPLPTGGSAPFGVVYAPDGAIWFTEAAADANRIGRYLAGN